MALPKPCTDPKVIDSSDPESHGHVQVRTPFWLSRNENPYPPLPSVRTALTGEIDSVNRYPEMAAHDLMATLSDHLGLAQDRIVVSSGSSEVLSVLIRAATAPGDEVLFAWRSFELYPLLVAGAGATPVTVPLSTDLRHDFSALADAVTIRTRLILVCNPNNPTGTVVTATHLRGFLDTVPDDVVVVIDEAYVEFNNDPSSPNGIDFFGHYPNVAVCRTFSKAYGLAGLRVGYALAPPKLAEEARRLVLPFSVTSLAQRAALASLAAEAELAARVRAITERRQQAVDSLSAQGWQIPASQANFIWLPTADKTREATAILDHHGLVGRAFPGEGIRITIGEEESMGPLVEAAGKILGLLAPN